MSIRADRAVEARHLAARACAHGQSVSTDLIDPLRDSTDIVGLPGRLPERLRDDGYLFVRGAVPEETVTAARRSVFARLAEVGEVADPDGDARATGRSERAEKQPDKGAFWQAVSEQPAMRAVTHGPALRGLLSEILDTEARPFDFVFLRPSPPGRHTNIHCDAPFFTRASQRVVTCWIALGPVPVERGPLFVVDGSHRWADVRESVAGYDVARDTDRQNAVEMPPGEFAAHRRTRLLTADFEAGDVVIFGMYLLHGSLDNHDPDGRLRLSCDVRFQPESEPRDPRYFGPNPGGTTGAGYGELNGAKPLTEDWHQR